MQLRISHILFSVVLLIFSYSVNGQYQIEGLAGTGQVVRNHPEFPDGNKPASLISIRTVKHLNGYWSWHQNYRFPFAGIDITAGSMGNRNSLGYFAGAMGWLSFEKKIAKRWERMIKLSLGAAWFSKPYNEYTNSENVAIGSEVAFLAAAEAGLGYRVTDDWMLTGKLVLLHASNSHFKLPNVGMNLPAVMVGARYRLKSSAVQKADSVRVPNFAKLRFNLRLGLGVNESGSSTTPVNGPKYPVYLMSATVSRMFSPVSKVTAGVEAWYNKGVYDYIVSQEFYDEQRHEKSVSACVVVGHEFLFGRLGVVTTGGVYFYNPFYKDRLKRNEITGLKDQLKSYIPARLGVQYHLKNAIYNDNKNIFLGLYIKSNFGQADFLESGIGIVL